MSGYKLNNGKCGVVSRVSNPLPPGMVLYGVPVCSKVKYVGTWLGQASIME